MTALHKAVAAARELHNLKKSVTRQNVASLEKEVDEIEDRFQQEQKLRREAENTVRHLEQELAQVHVQEQQRAKQHARRAMHAVTDKKVAEAKAASSCGSATHTVSQLVSQLDGLSGTMLHAHLDAAARLKDAQQVYGATAALAEEVTKRQEMLRNLSSHIQQIVVSFPMPFIYNCAYYTTMHYVSLGIILCCVAGTQHQV